MRLKTKIIVLIIISIFLIGFRPMICAQQGAGKPPVEILTTKHPFYDALVLDDAFKNNKWKVIKEILSKYAEEEIKAPAQAQIKFEKNPFLTPYIEKWAADENQLFLYKDSLKNKNEVFTSAEAAAANVITETDVDINKTEALTTTATGVLSPVMIVDALGSFIAKRFKEELTIAYLQEFRDKLKEAKDNSWGMLFPATCDFLLNAEIFNFKLFTPTLKGAFQNDLNHLVENLIKFLKKKGSELPENEVVQKIVNSVSLGWYLFESLKKGSHPADVIESLVQKPQVDYLKGLANPDFEKYIRLLGLLSRNLRDKDTNGWIKPEEFKIFLKPSNIQLRELFIGLIYEREKTELQSLSFGTCKKNLADFLKKCDEKVIQFTDYVEQIIIITNTVQNQIKQLEGKEKLEFKEYHTYLSTFLQIIEVGYDLIKEFDKGMSPDKNKIDDLLKYGEKILEISQNIHDKAYGAAFSNALGILKELLNENDKFKELVKYGTFIVAVVNAKNSKEIESALETAALPVGSYRIKRASFFSISLSTYPGIFGGRENLIVNDGDIKGKPEAWTAAFTAPVGIDFIWGEGKVEEKPGPSFGFFISAIDIGAVVSLRLSGEDKGLPEFKLKNILAPGLFFVYGLKNSPITLGAGIQYGPQLREIKPAEAIAATQAVAAMDTNNGEDKLEAVIESSAFRFGIMISVDIPIFNFYSKKTGKICKN